MFIRFTPKLSLLFDFRSPIQVPNFSQIGACICKLCQFLQSVQNDEINVVLILKTRCHAALPELNTDA